MERDVFSATPFGLRSKAAPHARRSVAGVIRLAQRAARYLGGGVGLVLASVADVVIGSFWIYGNEGQGFFPLVSDLNWMIYIGSQCLVLHLPRVTVRALGR